MSRLIPATIRAIFFDAVGTLLHSEPAAPLVYAEVGRRHGSRLEVDAIADRFRAAFQRQEEIDRATGGRTSEAREIERWQHIVGEVLSDVDDPAACFEQLFNYFSRPAAWRCDPEAGKVVRELTRRGYMLGIASNFDHRLRTVAAGFRELASLRYLAISSEIGWRKPAPQFFAAVCRMTRLEPHQILIIGDDLENDYEAALAAGMGALWFAAENRRDGGGIPRLPCLSQLLDVLH
jgi:putative hydrolase of the HAD superfamily